MQVPLRIMPINNEHAPKMPKPGYVTSPSISDLQKLSTIELEHVKNFSISNIFGLIEFPGETDLADVDLADVVTIELGGVEVYDETRHVPYPKVGSKLNRPARITLYQVHKPDDMTIIEFIHALEDNAAEQDVSITHSQSH